MSWISCHGIDGYETEVELTEMEIPLTIVVDGKTYHYDIYRGIYSDVPFTSKQQYLESIDNDVPF